ncbi:hypothetical protein [Luteipulveratus halotolerans]|uniref:Uncharacterized protein n=1 Tax=Luteipulveratus halotolerans TaxID=1631356 RepID=A0A0L6CPN1_9MICO|nr:hypothetical protein [Luteipulveratus halotolerans]KNX39702.1 hypothetical protein VV01_00250 [Luteipulveratus halotolerans]
MTGRTGTRLPAIYRRALERPDRQDSPTWARRVHACAEAGPCRGCGGRIGPDGDPIVRWCEQCLASQDQSEGDRG